MIRQFFYGQKFSRHQEAEQVRQVFGAGKKGSSDYLVFNLIKVAGDACIMRFFLLQLNI